MAKKGGFHLNRTHLVSKLSELFSTTDFKLKLGCSATAQVKRSRKRLACDERGRKWLLHGGEMQIAGWARGVVVVLAQLGAF